jgi:hypothetical protein
LKTFFYEFDFFSSEEIENIITVHSQGMILSDSRKSVENKDVTYEILREKKPITKLTGDDFYRIWRKWKFTSAYPDKLCMAIGCRLRY